MPCQSDHLQATFEETNQHDAAVLLKWALKRLGRKVPAWVNAAASDYYGRGGENAHSELCALLTKLPKPAREALVYDAKKPMARRLADWWEAHQKQDKKNRSVEAERKRMEARRAEALAKLTPADRRILGLD